MLYPEVGRADTKGRGQGKPANAPKRNSKLVCEWCPLFTGLRCGDFAHVRTRSFQSVSVSGLTHLQLKRPSLLGSLNQLHLVRFQFQQGARDHNAIPPLDVYLGPYADPWAHPDPQISDAQAILVGEHALPPKATWHYGHTILAVWRYLLDFPIPLQLVEFQ